MSLAGARRPIDNVPVDLRRAIAPALAFWLSGACCLLLCAAVCGEARADASAERDCCTRNAEIEAEEAASCRTAIGTPTDKPHGECCFLSTRAATNVPLPDGSGAPAVPPAPRVSAIVLAAAAPAGPLPQPVPATSRGDTYLRCCVLLI